MRIVLDTNCFIDAVTPTSHAYSSMQEIFKSRDLGLITVMISRHTLHELEHKPDKALDLAKTAEILPHFPVGTWKDQIATWDQVSGTWDDAKRNQVVQEEIKKLAKAGADIRDRGAYIDALCAKADAFVTSDTQVSGSGPAGRIATKYGLRVLTPVQMAAELPEE